MLRRKSLSAIWQEPFPEISGGLADSCVWPPLKLSHEGLAKCAKEVFSKTTTNVRRNVVAFCEDVIDGAMDEGVGTRIVNPIDRQCWVPTTLSDKSHLESKYVDVKHNVTAWTVGGTPDLVVIGFSDPISSGETFYPAVFGSGKLLLTADGHDPESLSESAALDDDRVMRYFKSTKLNDFVLQSVKHKLFITKYDGYIIAQDIDEQYTTAWNIA